MLSATLLGSQAPVVWSPLTCDCEPWGMKRGCFMVFTAFIYTDECCDTLEVNCGS